MDSKNFKKTKIISLLSFALVVILLVGACSPANPNDPTGDPVAEAMKTLEAQATQDYYNTVVAQVSTLQTQAPQVTPDPTNINQMPGSTQAPKETTVAATSTVVVPTVVPATKTPMPPTATPKPCLQVSLVSDVTIPDGSKIRGGEYFTKTWRLQNSGTCRWDEQFDIVFIKGSQLGANSVYDIPKPVNPGETIDISIGMVAPSVSGRYRSEWQLKSSNGVYFGLGADSKSTFWADIESIDGKGVVYNFAESVCSAKWTNGDRQTLKCPGSENDVNSGYVLSKAKPLREDGATENEIGLISRPNRKSDGYIQGVYPAINIKDGDRFKATVMCESGATDCDIKFDVYYSYEGQTPVSLGRWHEYFDGSWTHVDVDLSFLAGRNVTFNLVVWNGNSFLNNRGLWLNPHILRTK
jgi:hypothetical protein